MKQFITDKRMVEKIDKWNMMEITFPKDPSE